MIAWTNKSDLNLNSLSRDKIQKLEVNKINGPPKKIYFKDTCIIILTENGDVYKKGKYNFMRETIENQKENEEWKAIIRSREITKIKFGYYHILFLSKIGKIYALGDNYYGQLGVNKMMNAMTKMPIEVKYRDVNLIGKKIHAYKYNSFVIDKENKLYIWGKSDYLMGIYNFNLFLPTIFIPDYKVDDIKHSEGRIIIHAYKEFKSKEDNTNGINDDDIYEMEINLNYKENENINHILKDNKSSIDQKSVKSIKKEDNLNENKSLNIDKEKNEENVKNETKSFGRSLISKKEEFKESEKNAMQIKAEREKKRKKYKTISQSMEEFSNKINTQEPYLKKIKQYILNKEPLPFLERENLNIMRDDLWEKLNKIILDNNSIQQINLNLKIPNSKRLALFGALFTVNISLFLEKIDFKAFVDSSIEMSKKCEDLIKKVQNNNIQKDKIINNNISNILNNALIYKNAENYIFIFSVFQYLFKNIDFEVLLMNLEDIFNQSSEIQTNSFLIEHIYQNIISINLLFEENLMRIKRFYNLSHLKIPELQKYIFKHIIETNEDIRDYWLFFCYHCKEEYILRVKKKKMDDINQYFINNYKKYKNVFDEYKKKFEKKYIKSKINQSKSEIEEENENENEDENVFQLYDNFIEEIKVNVKNEFYNEENKNEIMKKEMIIDFSTSVIQMFETKKLLLMLLLKYDDDGKI